MTMGNSGLRRFADCPTDTDSEMSVVPYAAKSTLFHVWLTDMIDLLRMSRA